MRHLGHADAHELVIERGICDASQSTIVRWLREDVTFELTVKW